MPFFLSVQSDLLLDTWSDLDESWRVYRVHPALLHGAIFDFRFWPWTGSGAFPYHVIYVLWEKYLGRGERSKVGTYLLRTRIVNCTHPQNFIRIGSCVQEIVRHKSSQRTLKKTGSYFSNWKIHATLNDTLKILATSPNARTIIIYFRPILNSTMMMIWPMTFSIWKLKCQNLKQKLKLMVRQMMIFW